MDTHQFYMQRCMDLAKRGMGDVKTNPMVGAILVYENKIIGEGWHKKFGGAHAEVNCIESVKPENKHLISLSTLYVNLEPCSHFGKTPPCADLIIHQKIKKVVVGIIDPNPKVAGDGIRKLILAGIDVVVNVLQKECKELNKRFFVNQTYFRPYIFLKWAQTADGFIAHENYKSLKISNVKVDMLMHQLRANEDAIMVGFNTAFYDNPALTARLVSANKQPIRIVIDKQLKLPQTHKLITDEFPTIILNEFKNERKDNSEYLKVNFHSNWLSDFLKQFYERGISSIIVEGGTQLLNSFIEKGLWDEAIIITNTKLKIYSGIEAPNLLSSMSFKIEDNTVDLRINDLT